MAFATTERLGRLLACGITGAAASGKDGLPVRRALSELALRIQAAQAAVHQEAGQGNMAMLNAQTRWALPRVTAEGCAEAAREASTFLVNTGADRKLFTAATMLGEAALLGARALAKGYRMDLEPELGGPPAPAGPGAQVIQGRFGSPATREGAALLARGYGDGGPSTLAEADAFEARQAAQRNPPGIPAGAVNIMTMAQSAALNAAHTSGKSLDRDETIKAIREGLKKRTKLSWSVKGGSGTSWGWIRIDAPPARRVCTHDGYRTISRKAYLKTNTTDKYLRDVDDPKFSGSSCRDDREILGKALGLGRPSHNDGESIPSGGDYYREYVDRAQGRPPSRIGTPYWD